MSYVNRSGILPNHSQESPVPRSCRLFAASSVSTEPAFSRTTSFCPGREERFTIGDTNAGSTRWHPSIVHNSGRSPPACSGSVSLRNLLTMAHGAAETPVEAAGKNEKCRNRKLPHWKLENAHEAFAIWHQFQDMGHAGGKPVGRQCSLIKAATPAKVLFKRIIGSDPARNYQKIRWPVEEIFVSCPCCRRGAVFR